ncbi:MAG: hypothetical protein UU47_C0022G0015 [candidate division TM6 bacterium GW2011_GWE2_41_16]|nr:MAG: hypothetical protein UU47_C0022G0015 [candidate division TM6 bacterium GW2011_GWE2_41_16]
MAKYVERVFLVLVPILMCPLFGQERFPVPPVKVYKHRIFLASGSKARLKLLHDACFEVVVLDQTCDERSLSVPDNNPKTLVKLIANAKMDCVVMPDIKDVSAQELSHGIYVVTADSMLEDMYGQVHGKPLDYADAVAKIKCMRPGLYAHSGFCVERRRYCSEKKCWECVGGRYVSVDSSWCVINIPDAMIDTYLMANPVALVSAGAMTMEGPGVLFVRDIRGACSTLIGLPLHQLKDALDALGFFD